MRARSPARHASVTPGTIVSHSSRNVKALGVVSLLGDVASEMIYALLPLFLTTVLGAGATVIGAIEGFADSTSALLKLASGWWADRVRSRKPLVVLGYTLSAIARPLIGLAAHPWQVLAVRMTDRTGKGIRTSPRDALLADSVDASQRGRAYGFHRALDNVGAVLGPMLAWALFEVMHTEMRTVFLLSAIPGGLSIAVLQLFVREKTTARGNGSRGRDGPGMRNGEHLSSAAKAAAQTAPLGRPFWNYLGVLFVFTLSQSSDAFLLIRAQQLGVPVPVIPLLYALFNLVKAVSSTPGGTLSDRYGRRPLLVAGWALYALVYVAFAFAGAAWQAWGIFCVYGVFFGLTEGAEKALVADFVPASRRGTAFGWFNFAVGIAALPASIVFGAVWEHVSPAAALLMGASIAAVGCAGLLTLVRPPSLRG
jgi:MFS family permease